MRLAALVGGATVLSACSGSPGALTVAPVSADPAPPAPTSAAAAPAVTPEPPPPKPTTGSETPASVVAAKPIATSQTQPRTGGTLRGAITSNLASLEPHIAPPNAFETLWLAYDRLTAYDDKLQPQPALAESWDTGDFTSIKLSLRPGVQFHNGRELTSDDVKWNMLRVRDPQAAVRRSW